MTSIVPYISGLLIGTVTGLFYFGGLWFTIKKVPNSDNTKKLLFISYAVRVVPTLAIMLIVIRMDPGMFVAMLLAFFSVRFFMTRKIAPRDAS